MMMGWSHFHQFFVIVVVVFLSLFTGRISTSSISAAGMRPCDDALPGRSLLQAKKSCPVSFEFQNYSIITNQCKGPEYPPNLCCSALKKFACPFADDINDLTNDCATTMFSYINLRGKYPPGLFANLCRDGKDGLECPANSTSESDSDNASSSLITNKPSFVRILAAAFLVVLLCLL